MPDSEQPHRIIYVSLVFHPDPSASSILFTDLFRRLAGDSIQITVLTGFPSSRGSHASARLPRHEEVDGIRIERCGLRIAGKSSLLTRALSYGTFLAHSGWKLARTGRGATVVGGTDPPFTSIALWLGSHLGRYRYQVLLLDLYPDGLVGLGALGESSPVTRLWRWFNRRSYLRAGQLLVIGRDMAMLLSRRYGIDPQQVAYIPHWGAREAEMGRQSGFLAALGLEGKFVVQYSSNMGLWHDIDCFVHAADRLRADETIHFLFIGKGCRRAAAEALARDLRLTNITWLDFLPRERLSESLMACDLSLISLRAGLEGVAVPSKLYGILASGRAVVAQVPHESEVAYVIAEEKCGIVVMPGDVEALAAAISRLAHSPDVTAEMGRNAAAAYRNKYTIDRAVAAFRHVWHLA